MATLTAEIRSYDVAVRFLDGRETRKLGNNTYVEVPDYADDIIGVRLHATVIVTYHRDGRIILNTGGWNTPTTRDRLNQLTPLGVSVSGSRGDRFGRAADLIVRTGHWEFNPTTGGEHWVDDIYRVADSLVTIVTDPITHEVLSIEGDRK